MSHDANVMATPVSQSSGPASRQVTGARGQPGLLDRRRWLVAVLIVGFAVHVLWRLFLVRDLIAPAAHADEDGYLLAARALAGGAGGYSTENMLFRRAGYPLLLAPIYWFTSDAFQVYRSAQVVNAVINAATFPLAFLFARRVFAVSRGWAVAGAFVVATMPAVAFYGQFAMADAVLATLGLGWLLLVHGWLTATTRRARLASCAAAGALAGLIDVVHVRGIMVVLAQVAMAVLFRLLRRVSWRQVGLTVLATGLAVGLDPLLKMMLRDSIITQGSSPGGQTVSAITTVNGIGRTVARLVGQLWYLIIGTWGLAAVALAVLLLALWPFWPPRRLRERLVDPATGTRTLMMLTTLVTTALVALSSSMSLPTWDHRINYFAYPRYIHFLFPVWMLSGLFALRSAPSRRVVGLAGGLLAASTTVTYAAIHYSKAYRFLPFDAPETSFLGWKWDAIQVVNPTLAGAVLFALLVIALPRRPWTAVAVTAVITLNVAVMGVSVERISKPMVVDQYRADTPRLIRDAGLHPGDVVAESTDGPWYLPYNHMREIWWTRLILFSTRHDDVPEQANVVIAPYHSDQPRNDWRPEPGFRLVVADEHHGWAVWRRS